MIELPKLGIPHFLFTCTPRHNIGASRSLCVLLSQAEGRLTEFLGDFVQLWERQLDIKWENSNEIVSLSEEGPHLSLLYEDLLPSLDKFLLNLKTSFEQVIFCLFNCMTSLHASIF